MVASLDYRPKALPREGASTLVSGEACKCSGVPPQEAPVMIAEKHKLFFSFFLKHADVDAILSTGTMA